MLHNNNENIVRNANRKARGIYREKEDPKTQQKMFMRCQRVDWADRDFKAAIKNIFKQLKEMMNKDGKAWKLCQIEIIANVIE